MCKTCFLEIPIRCRWSSIGRPFKFTPSRFQNNLNTLGCSNFCRERSQGAFVQMHVYILPSICFSNLNFSTFQFCRIFHSMTTPINIKLFKFHDIPKWSHHTFRFNHISNLIFYKFIFRLLKFSRSSQTFNDFQNILKIEKLTQLSLQSFYTATQKKL